MNAKAKFLLLMFLSFREILSQRPKQTTKPDCCCFFFVVLQRIVYLPILTTWFLICKESLDKKLHWQQQDFFSFLILPLLARSTCTRSSINFNTFGISSSHTCAKKCNNVVFWSADFVSFSWNKTQKYFHDNMPQSVMKFHK